MMNPRWHRAIFTLLLCWALVLLAFELNEQWCGSRLPMKTITYLTFPVGLIHCIVYMGVRRGLLFLLCSGLIPLSAEYIGVKTGHPFGLYEYCLIPQMGPMLNETVPYMIPMVWFLMLYASFVLSTLCLDGHPLPDDLKTPRMGYFRTGYQCLVGALVMTAWDLVLDPYATCYLCGWYWKPDPAYPPQDAPLRYLGIPFENYRGWVLTSFVALAAYRWLASRIANDHQPPVSKKWVWLLLYLYGWMVVGGITFGGPSETMVIAPMVMGAPLLVAFVRLYQWSPIQSDTKGSLPSRVSHSA